MQQLILDLLPPPTPTFENFVHGPNSEAVAALQNWLTDERGPTCFLLWGNRHSGRRHLAQALTGRHAELPAEHPAAARPFFRELDVDTLDEAGQARVFNRFNTLKVEEGRLLVTCLQPPAALNIREDLRTRLGSGLVYRLHALSDEEKRAALIDRAQQRGLKLPDDIVDYIFRHLRRDMGSLMALVESLDRYTLQTKRPVTLPLLRQLQQQPLFTQDTP